jgi:PBP1b-binding outer membrane lipoprotein LpoB
VRRLLAGLLVFVMAGCVDGLQSRHLVSVSPDTLSSADFVVTASAILQAMSNSPALNQQPPATMQLGAVTNETMLSLDVETMLARATTTLFKSERVELWSAQAEANQAPQLLLRGRIYEVRSAGNKSRSAGYYLRLTLVERSTGVYLWSEERKVQKWVKAEADSL